MASWQQRLQCKRRGVCGRRVGVGVKSCKIVFLGGTSYSPVLAVQSLLMWAVSFSHNHRRHRRTDRQTTLSWQ